MANAARDAVVTLGWPIITFQFDHDIKTGCATPRHAFVPQCTLFYSSLVAAAMGLPVVD